MKDCKFCTLNGRITTQFDNFTCVSGKGKSVVDYISVPHECIDYCYEFKVHTMGDIMQKHKLYDLLSDQCKAPDHSLLHAKFR